MTKADHAPTTTPAPGASPVDDAIFAAIAAHTTRARPGCDRRSRHRLDEGGGRSRGLDRSAAPAKAFEHPEPHAGRHRGVVPVRLSTKAIEALDKWATREGVARSAAARMLIEKGLEK
jgi:hypothetical protein